jgi:hypothetical protein
VADAIVECGRRTLTNAINLANKWGREENGRWSGAYVLYGDTDSVFIKLPGRSVQEAFRFGEEYCKSVTASNPPPVSLKLEKVYSQSLLQTVSIWVIQIVAILSYALLTPIIALLCYISEEEILWNDVRIANAETTIF